MSIMSDVWIMENAAKGMIKPYAENGKRPGKISYGVSSYGYDIRLADEFKLFTNAYNGIIDPKNFNPEHCINLVPDKDGAVVLPPNSFTLAKSVEWFKIPRDILTVCLGKSTYARCGIIVNVTPFEPEWEGIVTLELSNTTTVPVKVYAGEGIAQVLFFRGDRPCRTSYKDKQGKYQDQKGLHLPEVDK